MSRGVMPMWLRSSWAHSRQFSFSHVPWPSCWKITEITKGNNYKLLSLPALGRGLDLAILWFFQTGKWLSEIDEASGDVVGWVGHDLLWCWGYGQKSSVMWAGITGEVFINLMTITITKKNFFTEFLTVDVVLYWFWYFSMTIYICVKTHFSQYPWYQLKWKFKEKIPSFHWKYGRESLIYFNDREIDCRILIFTRPQARRKTL